MYASILCKQLFMHYVSLYKFNLSVASDKICQHATSLMTSFIHYKRLKRHVVSLVDICF